MPGANTRLHQQAQELENVTTRLDTINHQQTVMLNLPHGQILKMPIASKQPTKQDNKQVELYMTNAGPQIPLEHIIQHLVSLQLFLDVK